MGTVTEWDVVIVGAGLAGSAAATLLARKGFRVALVDSRETYPACFKAEKIEPDQAVLLRKFGLLDGLKAFSSPIGEVISARNDKSLRTLRLEQYGIFYHDMVNGVRKQVPPSVAKRIMRVRDIARGPHGVSVRLVNGDQLRGRVVALACGTGGQLHVSLGMNRRLVSKGHSLAIGFNLAREDGAPFAFDALTYYTDGYDGHTAFLTLFPIRNVMRANYFVYRAPQEDWVRRFGDAPAMELARALPCLDRFTGRIGVVSRVEMSVIDLYQMEHVRQPGVVVLGDAFQSACPATGTGVSKVLTDVDVFCELVPEWLETGGMGVEKIAQFYAHPRKVACDTRSWQKSWQARRLATKSSLAWALYRELRFLGMRMAGHVSGLRGREKPRAAGLASS
jgi:2-polyprenyl-6-methoxyphenol hydroxylase-like FAD-dependent oxidoreductase